MWTTVIVQSDPLNESFLYSLDCTMVVECVMVVVVVVVVVRGTRSGVVGGDMVWIIDRGCINTIVLFICLVCQVS